jgi:hypothetical protein
MSVKWCVWTAKKFEHSKPCPFLSHPFSVPTTSGPRCRSTWIHTQAPLLTLNNWFHNVIILRKVLFSSQFLVLKMFIYLSKLNICVKRVNFQHGTTQHDTTRHDIENVGKSLHTWSCLKDKRQPEIGRPNQAVWCLDGGHSNYPKNMHIKKGHN